MGGGAQRALKLVRQLFESGWDPVVITRAGERHERYNPSDGALAERLPERHRDRTGWPGEAGGPFGWSPGSNGSWAQSTAAPRWWSRAGD